MFVVFSLSVYDQLIHFFIRTRNETKNNENEKTKSTLFTNSLTRNLRILEVWERNKNTMLQQVEFLNSIHTFPFASSFSFSQTFNKNGLVLCLTLALNYLKLFHKK